MNVARTLLRLALGRRLPITRGTLRVEGLDGPLTIRRDGWGIPHVDAGSDGDAFFALGFCLAQDRAFQLETMLRAGRGTLAELAGREALPIDRLSRRIGFHRAATAQLDVLHADVRARIGAYVGGINAGLERGLRRRPHELALARMDPTPWTPADALAAGKLTGFGLAANWDIELDRLRVLALDGPEALAAVDTAYADWLAVTSPPGTPAGPALDRLAAEAGALGALVPGGGSNNWAVAGSRTATGRPLVANDPHLGAEVPSIWYLVHLRTPEWSLAGASAPGLTGVAAGHNGFAAWGVTNGSADVVDLFIEEIGPDGESVLGRDGFEACEVREERIGVRGGEDVVERVLITPRGPVISPALPDPEASALSMRAVFLEPLPIEGFLALERVRSFEQFRARFAAWPVAPFNLVYGDVTGAIGWHFAGDVPRRQDGEGLLPRPGRDAGVGWEDGMIEAARMPWLENPQQGFVATANNKPVADGAGPWLGADWMDGYRVQRLAEALGAGENWDVASSTALQLDRLSLPWRELRDAVLDAPVADDPRARRAVALLSDWDGVVDAGSPAAAVFELFLAELTTRAARSKAPRAAAWALGRGANPLLPHTYVALRWVSKLSGLLRERPEGWFAGGWDAELAAALATAVQRLEDAHGADPAGWAWGGVRPLTLRHPLGDRRPFDRIFNLGPIPYGGDANTPAQASNPPPDPTGNPVFTGTLRMTVDVGAWEAGRWVLAGGQSGNPLSPHYDDQFERWRRGEGIPIAWGEDTVRAAARDELVLEPL